MGETTGISWTSATWNPWQGCRRKSEGCRFCYMFRDKARYGQDPTDIHRSSKATFLAPLKWQREVEAGKRSGDGRLVFTCSWSDWFIKEADAWRDDGWAVIRQCPDLIFQILTKRADRMADHLPTFWDEIRDRCWLGVSAEDQKNYDKRRPFVDADLAPVMWWSLEPLLGPIHLDLEGYRHRPAWIVAGGESGSDARPMHPDWARLVRNQCYEAKVPFLFKQHGEWAPSHAPIGHDAREANETFFCPEGKHWTVRTGGPGRVYMRKVGKKAAGALLDGVAWNQFPSPTVEAK